MYEYQTSAAGGAEFAKLGIKGYENKSPDQLAIEVMRKAKDFYKTTPQNLLQNYAENFGYSALFSPDELRRLGVSKDLESQVGSYGRNKRELEVSGAGAYQDFKDAMSVGGAKIEGAFGSALSGLTAQLTKLTSAFAKAVSVFLRSDLVGVLVGFLVGDLEGVLVGLLDGDLVGDVEGDLDGDLVGDLDGDLGGVFVGEDVGFLVGVAVP